MASSSSRHPLVGAQAQLLSAMYHRLRRLAQALEGELQYLDSLPVLERAEADDDPLGELFGKLLEAHEEAGSALAELGELLANRTSDPDGE